MGKQDVRLGLRLFELETGLQENIEDTNSAELVDYETSRIAGRAARLAMVVRGQDIIEDEQQLKKLVAFGLDISASEYKEVKNFLMEVDLLQEATTRTGKRVLIEKVERINHTDNYDRIGSLWLSRGEKTAKEEALVHTLDRIVERPLALSGLTALGNLSGSERATVMELGQNAGVIDVLEQQNLYYSPMLWDVDPKKLSKFLAVCDDTAFTGLLTDLRSKPGTDITASNDQIVLQAISGGIVPMYRVHGGSGVRHYGFAPYTGNLLTNTAEKGILDKARALVSCLRYGGEAAKITRIRNARWILAKLMDAGRGHRVGSHSELKGQYGMLVAKQIGRLVPDGSTGRYFFELIPTKDNLRACNIAMELLSDGETLAHKAPDLSFQQLGSLAVNHPLKGVRVAKKKRAARADELAGIVEGLQTI